MSKKQTKLIETEDDLQQQIDQLKLIVTNYEKDIEILEKLDQEPNTLKNQLTSTKIDIPEGKEKNTDDLRILLSCLADCEEVNGVKFKNETVNYLDTNNEDILYNKLYEADGEVGVVHFHIKIYLIETRSHEYVDKLDIDIVGKQQKSELAESLSVMKRKKNLHMVLKIFNQYSLLHTQRENILNNLIEIFKTKVQDNGTYLIRAETNETSYFICTWGINWLNHSLSVMHCFEFTLINKDPYFTHEVIPLIESLCTAIDEIETAEKRLKLWKNLSVLIKHCETRHLATPDSE